MLWLICLCSRSFTNIKYSRKIYRYKYFFPAIFHNSLKNGFIWTWCDLLFCLLVLRCWHARFALTSGSLVNHTMKTLEEREKQSKILEWLVWVLRSRSSLYLSWVKLSNDLFFYKKNWWIKMNVRYYHEGRQHKFTKEASFNLVFK